MLAFTGLIKSSNQTAPSNICYNQTNQTICSGVVKSDAANGNNYCGIGPNAVQTSINFGCKGTACYGMAGSKSCPDMSPITDIIYAIIRFLSIGVGIVVVASMVYAGMQYIGSRGEPQATEQAVNRIRSNIIAIIIYIFAYAILSFVIPPGFLN